MPEDMTDPAGVPQYRRGLPVQRRFAPFTRYGPSRTFAHYLLVQTSPARNLCVANGRSSTEDRGPDRSASTSTIERRAGKGSYGVRDPEEGVLDSVHRR